jgi:DNA-binding transcriptional ArsR family regulator
MNVTPDIARVAGLLANPARGRMLDVLFDGDSHSAAALASAAGVAASTASEHLSQLVGGGLVLEERSGRHRRFRLAGPDVAHALEALASLAPPQWAVAGSQPPDELRLARTCYDHLAGALGVALTDALLRLGALVQAERELVLTEAGERLLADLDVDVERARKARRSFAIACIDWSERRPHLAGALGAAVASRFFELGWVVRREGDRVVRVSPEGARRLSRALGLDREWLRGMTTPTA